MRDRSSGFVGELESRTLLSGTTLGGWTPPPPPDATIQADLAAVKAAQTALAAAWKAAAPTIAADQKA